MHDEHFLWQESWAKNFKGVKCNLQVLAINSGNTMHLTLGIKLYFFIPIWSLPYTLKTYDIV